MAVTQVAFDRELQLKLNNAGFDLNKKDVQELLGIVGDTVKDLLKQEIKATKNNGGNPTVVVRGLGRFTIRNRPAGWGRNPGTGEKIRIKASKKMRVLAPKALRDELKVK